MDNIITIIVNIATVVSLILSLITLRQSLKDKKEYAEKLRQIYSFQSMENRNHHLRQNINECLVMVNDCQKEVDRFAGIPIEKVDKNNLDFKYIHKYLQEMESKLDANLAVDFNINQHFSEIRKKLNTILKDFDDPAVKLTFNYYRELHDITTTIGRIRKNMHEKIVELDQQLENAKIRFY